MKEKIKEKIKQIYPKINVYLIYTILFTILSFLIYYIFLKTGKSFIWQEDGLKQHFAILYNFNETIRNAFTNGISLFSWKTGLGLDVIGQYSYYILGDPFAYLSLLFPINKLELSYNLLIIIRMYFVGIAFLAFCKYNKKDNFNSILGCIIYTFSGFILYSGVRHPYFLNAAILLPLVFLGIDKLLKEDKINFFIIMIAITAVVNYYFLYMITILGIIYGLVKYISEYKNQGIKVFLNKLLKTFLGYIIGILIAGIILLPTIHSYLNSNRLTNCENVKYNFKYYASLFTGFTSNNSLYWTRICTTSFTLIMLPVAFVNRNKNKENRTFFINIIITTIMLLIPFCGSLMNGLSFSTNRWVFGYVFLLSYMIVLNFRKDLKYTKEELAYMALTLIVYCIGIVFCKGKAEIRISLITTFLAIIMFSIIALINMLKNKTKYKNIFSYGRYFIFSLIIINIVFCGYNLYSKSGKKYIKEFIKSGKVIQKYDNYDNKINGFDKAIEKIKNDDNTFYRISTNKYNYPNISLVHNYKSLNSYLSIGNKYIGKLSKDISNRLYNSDTNPLKEFDNRTRITTLLGTKYFIINKKNEEYVPYGYNLYDEISEKNKTTQIYKNQNNLGLGVFYDNYILQEQYNKLNALEKEQIMLDTAVLEQEPGYDILKNVDIVDKVKSSTCVNVKYKIRKNKILEQNKITTTKKNQKLVLDIDKIENSELYLVIQNFEYAGTEKNDIKINYKNIKKIQKFRDKEVDPYYSYNPNILINLGYSEIHNGKIEIQFTNKGKYSFKKIYVIAIPMDSYDKSIQKLKQTKFNLEKYENDEIIGNIQSDKSGILQLSIPYTKGWTAYVDGKKVDTTIVNTAFIGIYLEKGNHNIVLKYETPYLKLGIVFSIIGVMLFIFITIYQKRIIEKNSKNGDKDENK